VAYSAAVHPRRFVHVEGVRTAYVDVGAGEPIVALHGIPTSSELFDPLLPALVGFRVIAPDLLGQGETAVPAKGPVGHAEYAAHLAAFLDVVAPPTFHLVVHDLGGVLGLEWAAAHPERLRTLVVLSATGTFTLRWAMRARLRRLRNLLGGVSSMRRWIREIPQQQPAALDVGLAGRWARPWTRRRALRGRDHYARPHLARVKAGLARIHAPVLLLWGDRDEVFPRRHAKRLRRRLSSAELKVIEGGGHWLPLDVPWRTGEEIAEFIRRAGTGTSSPGERVPRRFRPPTST
jgi:pimeloyl-ACP methyl ester carboxylesterase